MIDGVVVESTAGKKVGWKQKPTQGVTGIGVGDRKRGSLDIVVDRLYSSPLRYTTLEAICTLRNVRTLTETQRVGLPSNPYELWQQE